MFKNFLTTYIRSLSRNKAASFINIFGLSLGLASCFIIMLFVIGELRMDSFQKNRKDIYRVTMLDDKSNATSSNVTFLFGPTVKQELPEVSDFARVIDLGKIKTKLGNETAEEGGFLFADQSIFNILSFDNLEGEVSKALTGTNNVAISKTMAQKYFNTVSAVGKSISVSIKGEDHVLTVSAVYNDLPLNSSININFLANIEFGKKNLMKMLITYGNDEQPKEWKDSWDHNFFSTLLKINPGTDINLLTNKINQTVKKYTSAENKAIYSLQRYDKIYLNSDQIMFDNWAHGKRSNIYIFSSTALLILIIACFNYLILSLAQSEKRAREIGIRKASGADFNKLLQQVMFESVMVAVISLPLAIGFTELLLPVINTLLDKNLVIQYSQNMAFIAGVLTITLLVGLIPGFYLAFYLNKFNPTVILRGNSVKPGVRSVFLKSLVIGQVSIFIALIICSTVILKQLKFAANYTPGIKSENVVIIPLNDFRAQMNYNTFKQELEKLPEVQSVSASLIIPPSKARMTMGVPRVDDPSKTAFLETLLVDYGFVETMGITMTEGHSFSRNNPGEASGVILNEAAITELGLKETLGTKLPFGTVIGVMKNFHIHDLRSKIPPVYLVINNQSFFEMAVKTKGDYSLSIPKIKAIWDKVNSGINFESSTLADKIEKQYRAESRLSAIILSFTAVAIIIAAMGLFGLSFFISRFRTKEIGIRKVNGGSLLQMIFIFWKEIILWTVTAFVLASPLAWYFMNKWLSNFAYKTSFDWWIFAIAGFLALIIALIAVSWQAYRSANCNPVEALRYE